jgi:PIN domain nuclease of toxin-antitoxin system
VEMGAWRLDVHRAQTPPQPSMILLDTNALLWLDRDHARSRPLRRYGGQLYASPANLLELQFLVEAGRIRPTTRPGPEEMMCSDLWMLDDPPAAAWFEQALSLSWTRDPFDRLLVAHARLRGWRLATSDGLILDHQSPQDVFEL